MTNATAVYLTNDIKMKKSFRDEREREQRSQKEKERQEKLKKSQEEEQRKKEEEKRRKAEEKTAKQKASKELRGRKLTLLPNIIQLEFSNSFRGDRS